MSDRNDSDELIKNEETLNRRAWVDRAIERVRQRLERVPERAADQPKAKRPRLFVIPGRKDS